MQITNDARDALKNIFQERNVKGVRVYFAGFG
jgi:hypothetical protein